jgi:hypothetical protein
LPRIAKDAIRRHLIGPHVLISHICRERASSKTALRTLMKGGTTALP